MSTNAFIEIIFDREYFVEDVLNALISYGWSPNDNGKIVYLPGEDNGLFDWQSAPRDNWQEVKNVICLNSLSGEAIGIALTWKDSMVGGLFLIDGSRTNLSVSLSINRIRDESGKTQFSWYIDRIVGGLNSSGIGVSSIDHDEE